MRARRIIFSPRRLPPDRARQVDEQLRARADQLKPRRTPLGICHACATIVYTGDSLAITGGHLLHGDCSPEVPGGDAPSDPPPAA
jgi:hypothetical protein